jgi:signal transduction histidine kinase/CheY-like chemotaxis protein
VQTFESFAYANYNRTYPGEMVARSDFGYGIYALKNASNGLFSERYHDTTGDVSYHSPYRILVPTLQGNKSGLMFNIHSEKLRGSTVDEVITCSAHRTSMERCGSISLPTLSLNTGKVVSIFISPVYPAHNITTVVAVAVTGFIWEDILAGAFPEQARGLQCVLQAGDVVYTFTVIGAEGVVAQCEDAHSSAYHKYAVSTSITQGNDVRSPSANYTLTIYPTHAFEEKYRDQGPLVATIVVVAVILLLGIVLTLGVQCAWIRRANTETQHLARAKRQFVRYISHEIRTPLNTVSLGLNLLLGELSGVASPQGSPMTGRGGAGSAGGARCRQKCEEWCKLTAELIENSQCAVMLLDDLLCFEQLEDGGSTDLHANPPLDVTVLPVWELLRKAVQLFDVRARLSDVHLQTEFEVDDLSVPPEKMSALESLRVLGNEAQLRRVVNSLLGNALQYSHEGGTVKIAAEWVERKRAATCAVGGAHAASMRMHTHHGDEDSHSSHRSWLTGTRLGLVRAGSVQLLVTDEGAGLTAEQTTQVFGKGKKFRFSQLQAGQGSGIGLFVCKVIAERHHARIKVSSEGPGKGSTYVLDLPAFLPAATAQTVGEARTALNRVDEMQFDEVHADGAPAVPPAPRSNESAKTALRHRARSDSGECKHPESSSAPAKHPCGGSDAESKPLAATEQDGALHTEVIHHAPRPALLKRSSPHSVDTPCVSKLFVNKRVLVVDDAPSNRKMLMRVLAKSGHVCDQAQDGQVAVDKYIASIAVSEDGAEEEKDGCGRDGIADGRKWGGKADGEADGKADGMADGFADGHAVESESGKGMGQSVEGGADSASGAGYDMILMDYEMPVMNGPTATARLRELGCMCPIVGVTGNVLGADVDYFLAQGADCVLPKPLQMSALEEVWAHFVAVRRSVSFGGEL